MTKLNTFHLTTQLRAHSNNINRETSQLENLEKIDASVLPAKILVLLSKYAKALKDHNDTIIQLSSVSVFKQIHQTSLLCEDPLVQKIHRQLLVQVNSHIKLGTMYLVGQKAMEERRKRLTTGKQQQKVASLVVRKSSFSKASGSTGRRMLRASDVDLSMSILS